MLPRLTALLVVILIEVSMQKGQVDFQQQGTGSEHEAGTHEKGTGYDSAWWTLFSARETILLCG